MDKKEVKNYDADQGLSKRNVTSIASATDATGMMYNPPLTDSELSSIRDMHTLQSTEFAATEFGEVETCYDPSEFDPERDAWRERRKERYQPGEFNPELAQVDPDINCVNSHDDRHASVRPLTAVDWSNGEGGK